MYADRNKGRGIMLAGDGQCQAEYSAARNAVQVRVGDTDVRLSPAEFLSVCATLLKAARVLGQQPYIPGLAPPRPMPGLAGSSRGEVQVRPE